MRRSADIQSPAPARRDLLLAAAAWSATPWSQTAAQVEPPAPIEAPRLLTNLLTRIGVQVDLGRRRAIFVIDTGAERTSISDQLAQTLELQPGQPVRVHGITAAELAPTVRLPLLAFAGRRFANLIVPVFPRGLLAADGLLGLDALARFRLTLDYRRRRVSLAPSGLDSPRFYDTGRNTRIPQVETTARTDVFQRLFITRAAVDGINVTAFIDTGAQYSIGNLALMRALDAVQGATSRPLVRVYGVIGQSMLVQAGKVGNLRLHRHNLGETPLLFGDLHAFGVLDLIARPALLLGADALTRFNRVILDYGLARVVFEGLVPPQTLAPSGVRSP